MKIDDACPRVHRLEPVALYDMRTGVGGSSGVSTFRVPTPDPRCWVKFGVLWVPGDGSTAPGATTLTLWIAATQRGGIGEGSGRDFPVEDLIGTSAAPLAIPTNTALFGKFVQVQNGTSGLQGVLTIATPSAGVQGTWYALASFHPAVDMPREEWDSIVGKIGGLAADNLVRLSV
jgi:hypothetical protein